MGEWLVAPSVDNVITRLRNGGLQSHERRALLDELDVVEAADYRAVVSSNRWLRDRAERAEADRHPGCTCPSTGDAPAMHHDYCAAHYGGQHHYDCVPREHRGCHWEHEAQRYAGNADYWRDRAERAERERDECCEALRKSCDEGRRDAIAEHPRVGFCPADSELARARRDNDRLREALIDLVDFAEESGTSCSCDEQGMCSLCVSRAALSADAEPSRAEYGETSQAATASPQDSANEPSRAEGDEPNPFRCQRCTVPIAYIGHHGDMETHVAPSLNPDRLREAVEANADHDPLPETRDAAGGRPREADPQGPSPGNGDASVDGGGDDGRSRAAIATEAVEQAARAHLAEARVRELEAVLSLFAGLSEHCARFGITQTALVNVSLLDRAHAAWQGGGGA